MASVGSATTPRTASTSIIIELHVPAGMMPGDGARVGRGEKEGREKRKRKEEKRGKEEGGERERMKEGIAEATREKSSGFSSGV